METLRRKEGKPVFHGNVFPIESTFITSIKKENNIWIIGGHIQTLTPRKPPLSGNQGFFKTPVLCTSIDTGRTFSSTAFGLQSYSDNNIVRIVKINDKYYAAGNGFFSTIRNPVNSNDFQAWNVVGKGLGKGQITFFEVVENVFYVIQNENLFLSEDLGENWRKISNIPRGIPVVLFKAPNNNIILATRVIGQGVGIPIEFIFTSNDKGRSWKKNLTVRNESFQMSGRVRIISDNQNIIRIPSALSVSGAPFNGWYTSSDNGLSWAYVQAPPFLFGQMENFYVHNNLILCTHFLDKENIYYTRDEGLTWKIANVPAPMGFPSPISDLRFIEITNDELFVQITDEKLTSATGIYSVSLSIFNN